MTSRPRPNPVEVAWSATGVDRSHRRAVLHGTAAALTAVLLACLVLPPTVRVSARAVGGWLALRPAAAAPVGVDLPAVADGRTFTGLARSHACPGAWAVLDPGSAGVRWCTTGPEAMPTRGADGLTGLAGLAGDEAGAWLTRWSVHPSPAGCTASADGGLVRVIVLGAAAAPGLRVAASPASHLSDAAVRARIAEADDVVRLASVAHGGRRSLHWAGEAGVGGCRVAVERADVAPADLLHVAGTLAALRRRGLLRPREVQVVLTTARRYCAIAVAPRSGHGAAESLGLVRVDEGCRDGSVIAAALTRLGGDLPARTALPTALLPGRLPALDSAPLAQVSDGVASWGLDAVPQVPPVAALTSPSLAGDGTLAVVAAAPGRAGRVWLQVPGDRWRDLDGDVTRVAVRDPYGPVGRRRLGTPVALAAGRGGRHLDGAGGRRPRRRRGHRRDGRGAAGARARLRARPRDARLGQHGQHGQHGRRGRGGRGGRGGRRGRRVWTPLDVRPRHIGMDALAGGALLARGGQGGAVGRGRRGGGLVGQRRPLAAGRRGRRADQVGPRRYGGAAPALGTALAVAGRRRLGRPVAARARDRGAVHRRQGRGRRPPVVLGGAARPRAGGRPRRPLRTAAAARGTPSRPLTWHAR